MVWNYLEEAISNYSVTTLTTLLVIPLALAYVFIIRNRSQTPGPTGLPLFGYWPFLSDQNVHLQLQDLKNKYGDVYGMNVCGQLIIHFGSIKALKEAHITKADCFAERYTIFSVVNIIFGKGIVSANGEKWKALRKFFVQAFREYGLTTVKGYMSGPIYDAVNGAVDAIKAKDGSPVNVIPILNDHSSDIFRRMMFNDGEIRDEELKGVLECYQKVITTFDRKNILLMGNFARYFVFPRIKGYKEALVSHKMMVNHLTKMVRRHEESYSEGNIRDIIDSYIKERNERRQKGDAGADYFSEEVLVSSLIQMVGDGILSVAIFIAYFIHALLEYPEEQEKVYKEIVDAVGVDGQITLEDRNKLPYTNAFMQEVMRTTDFFTLLPSLLCTKDTIVNGCRVPKGSITVFNLWACHHDTNTFEDPDQFRPSRYMSEEGKPKAEAPIIFGVGKRSCAGEAFTMIQVFLFLTTIIKNFRLERPKGDVKKNFLDGVMEVCAHPRK